MYDVIIIGAGPAGLTAAQVLGRQGRNTLVVDGGRPRNASSPELHMFPSRDGCAPAQLNRLARDELAAYPTVQLVDGEVIGVGGRVDDFDVALTGAGSHRGRRLILATGIVDELSQIDGIAERFGRGVYHCPFCHGNEVRGHSLAVINGGGPGGALVSLYLRDRFSEDVVYCTAGPEELSEPLRAALSASKIAVRTEPVRGVEGIAGALTVHFAEGPSLTRQSLFYRGTERQHSTLAADLGCELLPDGWVKVDGQQRTTVPGVFAAGDLARTENVPVAMAFVLTGAAAGQAAAVWLDKELFHATFPTLFH